MTQPINYRLIATDVTVLAVAPVTPSSGSVGTAQSVLGFAKKALFSFPRKMVDTTALFDAGYSERALRWDKGTVTISGFELNAASGNADLLDIYAAGYSGLLTGTLVSSGRQISVPISMHDFKLGIDDDINGEITANTMGVPQITDAQGGSLAAMTL